MYGVHENVYAVQTGDGVVLIDTGMDKKSYDVICRNLKYWGMEKQKINKILLTHAHYEHAGNCSRFKAGNIDIYIHEAEAEAVKRGGDRIAEYRFLGCEPLQAVPVCTAVGDGERIAAGEFLFEVIHVPGHSDGSVIYKLEMEGKVILFTGDTVLADKLCQESMVGWTGGIDYDEYKYIKSLEKLAAMDADIVLPGHGEVCMKDGGRLLNGVYLRARLLLTTQPHVTIHTDSLFR